ncbi:hypothetical protein CKA38_13620 [Ereboglobus luteus]|uniref:Uncharacterized protein n=1 Tax=Ereboglobus luteus TaxID=1796921 RepID=A0A2U8E5N3_9BACT|nr:hypothetical protein CKA38_13620 [Ereboglobus luteus]
MDDCGERRHFQNLKTRIENPQHLSLGPADKPGARGKIQNKGGIVWFVFYFSENNLSRLP